MYQYVVNCGPSVKLEDFEAALDTFESAFEMARLQDDQAAELAIKRAINDVNEQIVQREREGIAVVVSYGLSVSLCSLCSSLLSIVHRYSEISDCHNG